MIKYNNSDISKWYYDTSDIIKVYRNNAVCYYKIISSGDTPTPTGSTCYEVISTPITSYTSTTYDSVYSHTDEKWYILNNLNQYEEYGIYDIVENISSATTYEGKLGVVGTTEYQYSGDSWVVVGTYVDSSVTYTIDDTDPSHYAGQELSTTFKIPYADVESVGWVDLIIYDNNGNRLQINLDTGGMTEYYYRDSEGNEYNGTITVDSEYVYLSLPSEAPQNIVIDSIEYFNSEPIHFIVGSKQASVEYSTKTTPSSALTYSSVADMETVECPTVGVGQYCYTNGQTYKFTSNEEWVTAQDSEIMMRASDDSGNTRILACGYNDGAIPSRIAFDLNAVEAYFGDCVTSIGDSVFGSMYDKLESVSATSVVPPTMYSSIFSNNTSKLRIYVPCNLVHTYRTTYGWNGYANLIDPIESNCQAESFKARFYDANDNLIGELQRTYDGNGANITSAETSPYASSAYRVEIGDAFVRTQNGAFKGFTHITSLSLGNNVVFINSPFASGCTALRSIELPSKYNSYLNSNLIVYCNSLQSITIPSSTTAIYRDTINNCNGLQSITILTPRVLNFWGSSGTVFQNTNSCPIYVPSNLVNSYKSASGWSTVASRIQAIPTV